jgi:hypothetical protein
MTIANNLQAKLATAGAVGGFVLTSLACYHLQMASALAIPTS